MIPCVLPDESPTVLFDIDGTLMFLRGVGRRALEQAVHEVWGLENALEGFSFAGATDNDIASRIAPDRDPTELWPRYFELLTRGIESCGQPEPLQGVPKLLDALSEADASLGLLTGNLRASAKIKLDAIGLWERFDLAISAFADDGGKRVEVAEAARQRHVGGPLVIVGDSIADAEAARHIGARVLLTATGPQPRELLDGTGADLIVDDLSQTEEIAHWLLSSP